MEIPGDNEYIFEGGFGLERETLRITADGSLAQTPHPFDEDSMERDFCENQLEIITPVCESADEAARELGRLSSYAEERLVEDGEYLWIYSNPPHFGSEEEIPIARYSGDKIHKKEYRINLEKRYGKRLMLYSGIHFNFSFSERYIRSLCGGAEGKAFADFKNSLYLRLFKQASRYSWLLVLLTAASPVYDLSLEGDGLSGTAFDGFSTRRNSEKGYWNCFVPMLDYGSLEGYAKSVQRYIEKGVLFSAGELYLPVRLKPKGDNSLDALVKNGADHIELRMFDLNPLAPYGIFAEDLKFAHYFLIYLLSLPDIEFSPALQRQAIENHKAAAKFELSEIRINGRPADKAAAEILDEMSGYFSLYPDVLDIIDYQRSKLYGANRYSDKIYELFHADLQSAAVGKFTEERRRAVCASCSEPA